MDHLEEGTPSTAGHVGVACGPVGRWWVRAVLAVWIAVWLFVFCLQQDVFKYAGNGAVERCLRDLNSWVSHFTAPPTTFEPES